MSDLNPIYSLIRADGSIVISKSLCHAIGIDETIIYSELLSRYNYFNIRNELDKDGFFFNTINDLQLATCLGEKPQKKAINNLRKIGLIQYKLKGAPPKRYFKIADNIQLISELLEIGEAKILELKSKQLKTVEKSKIRLLGEFESSQVEKLNPPNGRVNNTNINNTNLNNTNKTNANYEIISPLIKDNPNGIIVELYSFQQYLNTFVDNDDMNIDTCKSIMYFLETRENKFNFEQPLYKYKTWQRIYDDWLIVKTGYGNEIMTYEESVKAIDKFFETKYKKECDYSPVMFSLDDIKFYKYRAAFKEG